MVGKLQVAPNSSPLNRKYVGNMNTPNAPNRSLHSPLDSYKFESWLIIVNLVIINPLIIVNYVNPPLSTIITHKFDVAHPTAAQPADRRPVAVVDTRPPRRWPSPPAAPRPPRNGRRPCLNWENLRKTIGKPSENGKTIGK